MKKQPKFLKGDPVEVDSDWRYATSYRGIIKDVKISPRKGIRYTVIMGNLSSPYTSKIEWTVPEHALTLVIPKPKPQVEKEFFLRKVFKWLIKRFH